MQLEHLNLVVSDIPACLQFYQAAFPHWYIRGKGEGDWNGKPRYWCHFGDDHHYITFNDNGEAPNRDLEGHQIGLAHFGFVTDDLKGVISRLNKAGFKIDNEGVDHPYRRNKYFIDPAGFEVEFVQYFSDDPKNRNDYI